jgi:hypothetical protein
MSPHDAAHPVPSLSLSIGEKFPKDQLEAMLRHVSAFDSAQLSIGGFPPVSRIVSILEEVAKTRGVASVSITLRGAPQQKG